MKNKSSWTVEENEMLKLMILDSKSKNAVCARLGRSAQSVNRQARMLNLRMQKRKQMFTADEIEQHICRVRIDSSCNKKSRLLTRRLSFTEGMSASGNQASFRTPVNFFV
jgi:hypothetical protein